MTLRPVLATTLKVALLVLIAFAILGPLANLVLWSFAERWYAPFKGRKHDVVQARQSGDGEC